MVSWVAGGLVYSEDDIDVPGWLLPILCTGLCTFSWMDSSIVERMAGFLRQSVEI